MTDQKPTLEYGGPDPPRHSLASDIAISVLLAAFGLSCIVVGGLWLWASYRDGGGGLPPVRDLMQTAAFAAFGSFSFWWMWKIIKRR